MWERLLLAIDQFESGRQALGLAAQLAAETRAEVRVLHVRELSTNVRVPPWETPAEAKLLVDEAVFCLRLAGVGAEGRACSVRGDHVARRIVQEASEWRCHAIVLGSRRLRGIDRLSGHGVRERVLRLSRLPVITAPSSVVNDLDARAGCRSDVVS